MINSETRTGLSAVSSSSIMYFMFHHESLARKTKITINWCWPVYSVVNNYRRLSKDVFLLLIGRRKHYTSTYNVIWLTSLYGFSSKFDDLFIPASSLKCHYCSKMSNQDESWFVVVFPHITNYLWLLGYYCYDCCYCLYKLYNLYDRSIITFTEISIILEIIS